MREAILRWIPDRKMLSYYQVKRRIADITDIFYVNV
jgi:hypothetical protein